jgi:hypothetical protein
MDLLLAILLYLGLVDVQTSYTTATVYSIADTNSQLVTVTSADSTAMRSVTDSFLTVASSVDVVDRNGGN